MGSEPDRSRITEIADIPDATAIKVLIVEGVDRGVSLLTGGESDEAESYITRGARQRRPRPLV